MGHARYRRDGRRGRRRRRALISPPGAFRFARSQLVIYPRECAAAVSPYSAQPASYGSVSRRSVNELERRVIEAAYCESSTQEPRSTAFSRTNILGVSMLADKRRRHFDAERPAVDCRCLEKAMRFAAWAI